MNPLRSISIVRRHILHASEILSSSPIAIENCVDFYFTNTYTTAWILSRRILTDSISSHLATDAGLYCFTVSLCAFVMVQSGMNLPGAPGSYYGGEPPEICYGYGNILLDVAIRVRKSINLYRLTDLKLHPTAALVQIMDMREEASYPVEDPVESIAYAMERHRPLSLHPTIELSTPQESHEEGVISGFLHLVDLFRCADEEFMARGIKRKASACPLFDRNFDKQRTDALPPELKTTESQTADIQITLHWLKTMVWQLSITNGGLSSSSSDSSGTFKYPIDVARDLIKDVEKLSLDSVEVHGIGLVEKLFDVACTRTDVISCVALEPVSNPDTETPSDGLNEFLNLNFPASRRHISLPSIAACPSFRKSTKHAAAGNHLPIPTPRKGAPFPTVKGMGGFDATGIALSTSNTGPQTYGGRGWMFDIYGPRIPESEVNIAPP
ncbi:uncharacterized protein Z518_00080 [Rhinocladiella mackenziei CBS 650.93]|uniref:Uncharacterized protein n=1 Tax=Rhinocladiella mackenziei CBS 650.93 TaxID=1442369 RepID=A0A0D2G3A3_9EURO|nr:uncharacterized protein Z518_00080 [Rhinocladiella mackenziei CBS 650.93]KIX09002.1 hypothetical protein Z518_00080 [Rhinocladiella mackenziei CBS 650.93]